MAKNTQYLRTSDLAKAVGIYPNTVRLYVDWGLLPPVERSPAGYRRFTRRHLDCLRLARLVYSPEYPGKVIRNAGKAIIQSVVAGDWGGALEKAYLYLALVQAERAQADAAATLLERWAQGTATDATGEIPSDRAGGQAVGVEHRYCTQLGTQQLIKVPRDAANGYRRFGAREISRLRVIRMLSRAGYSLMAILRMLSELDAGNLTGLRHVLDTPRADEDVYAASDRWISTLARQEQLAHQVIGLVEELLRLWA